MATQTAVGMEGPLAAKLASPNSLPAGHGSNEDDNEPPRTEAVVAVRPPIDSNGANTRVGQLAAARARNLAIERPATPSMDSDLTSDSRSEASLTPRNSLFWSQTSHSTAVGRSLRRWVAMVQVFAEESSPQARLRLLAAVICGLWCFVASLLLIMISGVYEGSAVDGACARYAASKAERVGAEVASVLSAALAVYDAMDYAIQQKVYFEPLDYVTVQKTLAPMFISHEAIRSVDIAFIDRNSSITVRRRWKEGNASVIQPFEKVLIMQSNAPDCYETLGQSGCLAAVPPLDQPWYQVGSQLPGNQESSSVGKSGYDDLQSAAVGSAFRWLDSPRFVPRFRNTSVVASGGVGERAQAEIAWLPAYSLVFRSVFPGTQGVLSLIGRITLEISGLRAKRRLQQTTWLGSQGAVYVCDRGGALIAADAPGQQAFVQSPTGRTRFRRAWELNASWARELSSADLAGGAQELGLGDFRVAVAPLPGRGMEHFRVLVAAERQPFVDLSMKSILGRATTLVALPYPAGLTILLLWLTHRWWKKRRSLKRVSPAPAGEGDGNESMMHGGGGGGGKSTLRQRGPGRPSSPDLVAQQFSTASYAEETFRRNKTIGL